MIPENEELETLANRVYESCEGATTVVVDGEPNETAMLTIWAEGREVTEGDFRLGDEEGETGWLITDGPFRGDGSGVVYYLAWSNPHVTMDVNGTQAWVGKEVGE